MSEQSTLKRSHDQITNQANEKSEQAMKKETVPEDNAKLPAGNTVYPGTEKQAKMFAAPGFSPKNIASYPSVASGASGASTVPVLEKSDHFHPTEVQLLRQKILDKMSPVQGVVYVPVTAQHGDLCAVNHQNISAIHDTRNAKDGATAAASSLTQSIPMGNVEFKCNFNYYPLPPGWVGAPYNGLYGEAPPKRGTFFRLEVCKRVGISRVDRSIEKGREN